MRRIRGDSGLASPGGELDRFHSRSLSSLMDSSRCLQATTHNRHVTQCTTCILYMHTVHAYHTYILYMDTVQVYILYRNTVHTYILYTTCTYVYTYSMILWIQYLCKYNTYSTHIRTYVYMCIINTILWRN